jgi:hypothetical protein
MTEPLLSYSRDSVREAIRGNTRLDPSYLGMNVLAATIACYGPSPTARLSSSER